MGKTILLLSAIPGPLCHETLLGVIKTGGAAVRGWGGVEGEGLCS